MAGMPDPEASAAAPAGRCPVWCDVEARWGEHGFDEFSWQDEVVSVTPGEFSRPSNLPSGSVVRVHASQLTTGSEGALVQLVQYEVKAPGRGFVTDARVRLDGSGDLTTAQARRIADALLRAADLLDSTT